MGHSGGTFFGIQAAARAPELYHAYIGVAQISNQLRSEALAYDYMLEQFRENGDTNMVQRLEAAPVSEADGIPDTYYALRDTAMHSLGVGTTHDMRSVLFDIVLPSWQCREYTIAEKANTWRGKIQSGVSSLWRETLSTDLNRQVTTLDIPVYFLHGVYDYTVSYTEAKAYFDNLQAPVKGFYTFARSAHSPMFEEPEKMQRIVMEDILTGTNGLADAQ
jgi:pimeloyl-ACP methyl ester carboxylesterase